MNILSKFQCYLQESIPYKAIYKIHFLLASLIILQIINSNFIHMTHNGGIKGGQLSEAFLWIHITLGLACVPLTLTMIYLMLKKQSFRQFFPYLFGDNQALKSNLQEVFHRKLPTLIDKGLANVVQGLGIGATVLVLYFGVAWFVL